MKIVRIVYFLAFIVLVSIMLYSYENYHKYYPSLATFQNDPESLEGVKAENCGIAEYVSKDQLVIRGGYERIQVKANNPRYPKYGTVCVIGYYNKEGYIEAEDIRYNDYIFVKYFLSSLSILYIIYVFFKEWKLTRKGFIEKVN